LNAEVLLAKRLKVNTSPTLFINNKIYSGEIKKDKIIRVICEYLPKSVSEQLSLCLNLPECFSDEDCALPEMIGKCLNPGTGESKCVYIKDTEVTLSILYSSTMINPDYYKVLDSIAPLFPNLKVIFTSIESDEGLKLKEKNKIKSIPVFIFDSTILRAQNYLSISSHLEKIENNYILNTSKYKNTELFFHETKINNQIDIFISPLAYQSYIVIDSIRKTLKLKGMYNLGIKYISQKDAKDNVFFRFGLTELEEAERQIAIQIYHPEKFFDYIKARSLNLNSSYWEDPITMLGLNPQEIKLQSKNETIISILKKNAEKTKNFRINSEVSVVINNQERIPLLNQNDLQILLKKLIKLFNAE
ncbi:hypothetical protein HY745_10075, partial [Candidatus Desantisbacteria bacterium]|nr:hypothetical protein [Candidatus Desantisbacteria bacterium]